MTFERPTYEPCNRDDCQNSTADMSGICDEHRRIDTINAERIRDYMEWWTV